jgi:hypothetical protein
MKIENVAELREVLKESQVSLLTYRIYPDIYNPDMCTCIEKRNEKWVTYYSERGTEHHLHEFDSEQDACEDMYYHMVEFPKLLKGGR